MTVRAEGLLLDWLRQRPPGTLSFREVVSIVHQAAYALQYAHNNQVVYQKVAPANFLIRGEPSSLPELQLIDVRRATSPGGLPNVLEAMAPEQWRGAPGPATDQYALAILAYQLLTWQSPFQGNQEQMMYQHLNVQPQPPGKLNPRIPPAVDAVFLRALAKLPEERFPSISAFADAFQQAMLAPTPLPASYMPSTPAPDIAREPVAAGKPSHGIRELLLLGLVFIVVVSGIGFGFYAIAKNNQAGTANDNLAGQSTPSPAVTAATTPTTATATITPTTNAATALAKSITSGTPVFADNLSSNTAGRWDANSTCVFQNGSYHVFDQRTNDLAACGSNTLVFDNVAMQVDVSLLSGNDAGLIFRYNNQSGAFYLFDINRLGQFAFLLYDGPNSKTLLQPKVTGAIAPGAAKNTLLVIAQGSDFKLFINGTFVGETQDRTLTEGGIDLASGTDQTEKSSEASYANFKVFSIPAHTPA
jgi:eukaryotic-like serine/threonine-protein kinase